MLVTNGLDRVFTMVSLEHIAEIRYEQSLFGRVLGYGVLDVRTTGDDAITITRSSKWSGRYAVVKPGNVTALNAVKYIPQPAAVYAWIVAAVDPTTRPASGTPDFTHGQATPVRDAEQETAVSQ